MAVPADVTPVPPGEQNDPGRTVTEGDGGSVAGGTYTVVEGGGGGAVVVVGAGAVDTVVVVDGSVVVGGRAVVVVISTPVGLSVEITTSREETTVVGGGSFPFSGEPVAPATAIRTTRAASAAETTLCRRTHLIVGVFRQFI